MSPDAEAAAAAPESSIGTESEYVSNRYRRNTASVAAEPTMSSVPDASPLGVGWGNCTIDRSTHAATWPPDTRASRGVTKATPLQCG